MGFKRIWDSSCPHVWDTWEAAGKTWVIQDLRPEDDAIALKILVEHMAADEALCTQSNFMHDPVSVDELRIFWEEILKERTTLACYTQVQGQMKLVALNCCLVNVKGEDHHVEIKGKAWKNVYGVIDYMESQNNAFEYLDLDKMLFAMGLVVLREYRGSKIGARLLNAREPLCRFLGVKGTATVFTGPASQKLAAHCGFTCIFEASWSNLADIGLDYPRNDKVVKFMIKKYD